MHRDHFGGLPAMLRSFHISHLYSSGERIADSVARMIDLEAATQHIDRRVLTRGDTMHLDTGLTLYILHPDHRVLNGLLTAYGQHINSGSLAFKVVYGATSFLFLGDIERSEEEDLRETYGDLLRSDVVKVAHHGSETSSSRAFADLVHATYAVISVGEHNVFGHPSPVIVKRWSARGAKVCRTDLDGAVLITSDGRHVEQVPWH